MPGRRSASDQRIARCIAVTEAYRRRARSTRQPEAAAADLDLDEETFKARLAEARKMGWLRLDD